MMLSFCLHTVSGRVFFWVFGVTATVLVGQRVLRSWWLLLLKLTLTQSVY